MAQLHNLDAAQLSAAYRKLELSPVEVTTAVLEHIERWEPKLNAMYLVHRERALEQAKGAEARWRNAAPLSPIDGVPITIKENIFTAGDPAPIGSAAADLTPKSADAPSAARSREAGTVLLGKTTMPDFGMLSAGLSSFHGRTRNPWNLERNTSGSSSGAGAAGAAGYGPLHIGTDIGGSVRLPATHCGLFALKPSLGRIPVWPPFMGRVAGPMTRTVLDSAMLLQELARPDTRDFMSLPYQPVNYAALLDQMLPGQGAGSAQSLRGMRIGLMLEAGVGMAVDPQVRAASQAAAQALEREGAVIEPCAPFMTDAMLEGMARFFEARAFGDVNQMSAEQKSRLLPFILEWATHRAASFSGNDVMQGYMQVMAMREAAVQAIGQFDFVISPTSPIPAYAGDQHAPGDDPRHAFPHIGFTLPYNMSEQPASSVQWSFTDNGLPIGVQVIGQRFDDLGVMQLSRVLEVLRPAQLPWPELNA
jgi:aspartyl-tRNA(Asn)/glutamyl-tRNA(Gln) amidotransferase subunit A